jgi:hypothetical protein
LQISLSIHLLVDMLVDSASWILSSNAINYLQTPFLNKVPVLPQIVTTLSKSSSASLCEFPVHMSSVTSTGRYSVNIHWTAWTRRGRKAALQKICITHVNSSWSFSDKYIWWFVGMMLNIYIRAYLNKSKTLRISLSTLL